MKTGSYDGSIIISLSFSILNLSTPGTYILSNSICWAWSSEHMPTSCYHWLLTSIHMLSSCVSIWYSIDLQPSHYILYLTYVSLNMNYVMLRVRLTYLLAIACTCHWPFNVAPKLKGTNNISNSRDRDRADMFIIIRRITSETMLKNNPKQLMKNTVKR